MNDDYDDRLKELRKFEYDGEKYRVVKFKQRFDYDLVGTEKAKYYILRDEDLRKHETLAKVVCITGCVFLTLVAIAISILCIMAVINGAFMLVLIPIIPIIFMLVLFLHESTEFFFPDVKNKVILSCNYETRDNMKLKNKDTLFSYLFNPLRNPNDLDILSLSDESLAKFYHTMLKINAVKKDVQHAEKLLKDLEDSAIRNDAEKKAQLMREELANLYNYDLSEIFELMRNDSKGYKAERKDKAMDKRRKKAEEDALRGFMSH